ncbi:hypothetical protein PTTG_09903, partial [Puccinia triticina 1-1 BBBD Race 1]
MSESLSKNSVPKASGDKLSDLPTFAGGMANPTTAAMTQPLLTGDDLPLTSAGEALQVKAQSIAEFLVPQDIPVVEPITSPAKNTRAKVNPATKQKKSAKKQPDQSEKQAIPRAPRLPANDQADNPEQEIMELLGEKI